MNFLKSLVLIFLTPQLVLAGGESSSPKEPCLKIKFNRSLVVPVHTTEVSGAGTLELSGEFVRDGRPRTMRCFLLNEWSQGQSFQQGETVGAEMYAGGTQGPYLYTDSDMQISCNEKEFDSSFNWRQQAVEIINEAMKDNFEIVTCLADLMS